MSLQAPANAAEHVAGGLSADGSMHRYESFPNIMASRRLWRVVDRWMIRLPLAGVTFVSKIGAPGLAAISISFAIPFIYLGALIGVWFGRLVFDPARLTAYLLMAAVLWLMQLVQGSAFSMASLLMLCVLHLPYVLGGRGIANGPQRAWAKYRLLATVLAVCGIAQYALQFVIGPKLAFPMDNLVPQAMRVTGFNGQGWLAYGATTFKSNGVFMLEASFFSQLLAIAIIGELVSIRASWWRLALYVCATMVSYSGTGMLSLIASLPVWVYRRRRWGVAIGLIVMLVVVWLLVVSGAAAGTPLMHMVGRINEFSSVGSSGFARFVGGFFMFEEFLWPDPWRTLFGFGAGSFLGYSTHATYAAHGMALFKMVFEFGVVGAAAYFGFVAYCFSTSRAPLELRIAIFVSLMIQNYVPVAHGVALALLIWSSPAGTFLSRSKP